MYSKIPRTWSFHVVVLQRTAKKCTKNNNARAKPLFCSLNLLFCGVLIAVMVCLKVPNHHLRLASRKNRPLVEFSRISLHSSTRLRFLSKKNHSFLVEQFLYLPFSPHHDKQSFYTGSHIGPLRHHNCTILCQFHRLVPGGVDTWEHTGWEARTRGKNKAWYNSPAGRSHQQGMAYLRNNNSEKKQNSL